MYSYELSQVISFNPSNRKKKKKKSRNHPILGCADFGVKKINQRVESVRYTTPLQPLT